MREWADVSPADQDRSDRNPFAEERRRECRALPTVLVPGPADRELLLALRSEVVDVHRPAVGHRAADYSAARDGDVKPAGPAGQRAVMGLGPQRLAVDPVDESILGAAQPGGARGDGFEHRCELRR